MFEAFSSLFRWLFLSSLTSLYLRGPSWIGCWEGKQHAEICSVLAPRTEATFWNIHMDQCDQMIANHLDSWIILSECIFCALFVYYSLKMTYSFVSQVYWRRTLLKDVRATLKVCMEEYNGKFEKQNLSQSNYHQIKNVE